MAGYGDDAGFAAWAASNGYTVPVGAPAVAVLRQRGSAYVDGLYGLRFSGVPTGAFAQERAWPRTGAKAYAVEIDSATIPVAVVQASYFAAFQEANEPGGLTVTASASGAVKREKVGPIDTEYFEGSGDALADATPTISAVEGLLAPFLVPDLPDVLPAIWSIG